MGYSWSKLTTSPKPQFTVRGTQLIILYESIESQMMSMEVLSTCRGKKWNEATSMRPTWDALLTVEVEALLVWRDTRDDPSSSLLKVLLKRLLPISSQCSANSECQWWLCSVSEFPISPFPISSFSHLLRFDVQKINFTVPFYIFVNVIKLSTTPAFLTVINICRCSEDGREKCSQYWPSGKSQVFTSGERVVEVVKTNETYQKSFTIRQLSIHPPIPMTVCLLFIDFGWLHFEVLVYVLVWQPQEKMGSLAAGITTIGHVSRSLLYLVQVTHLNSFNKCWRWSSLTGDF